MTAPYLKLTSAEWAVIRPLLPVPRRGPLRPHDRAVCAAFFFAAAARVSLECLPVGCFPRTAMLRTTRARWLQNGTFDLLMEIGGPVISRMQREYQSHLQWMSSQGVQLTGEATKTEPRDKQLLKWRKRQDINSWRAGPA